MFYCTPIHIISFHEKSFSYWPRLFGMLQKFHYLNKWFISLMTTQEILPVDTKSNTPIAAILMKKSLSTPCQTCLCVCARWTCTRDRGWVTIGDSRIWRKTKQRELYLKKLSCLDDIHTLMSTCSQRNSYFLLKYDSTSRERKKKREKKGGWGQIVDKLIQILIYSIIISSNTCITISIYLTNRKSY